MGFGIVMKKLCGMRNSREKGAGMRDQDPPSRPSTYRRQNGGNVIMYVLISFHSREVFCILSRHFVRPGFRLFCARLTVLYSAVYSILGSLVTSKRASVRYNSLFISLPLFTKLRSQNSNVK